MDLFQSGLDRQLAGDAPLAVRMRPRTLEEFIGQEAIVGEGTVLRKAIESDQLLTAIFWGPPGSGKTTLARIIANLTRAEFEQVSAVTSGVAEVRRIIDAARDRRALYGTRTTLFIDEIHRFNKAQQDALLPSVEDRLIVLIGATTENPYFEVNSALVSRAKIFRLEPLNEEEVRRVVRRALDDGERGLGELDVILDQEAEAHIVGMAGGDARSALNTLEAAVLIAPREAGRPHITLAVAEEAALHKALLYDKGGDAHYDTVSAFIKSMRGSDPDAALYWLARMLYAGEDPRFIARRMIIFASEDIGLADSQALVMAGAAAQAVQYVGLPECRLNLAHAVLYLALAPKSNSAIEGIGAATRAVESMEAPPVPLHLRDTHYRGAAKLGHGEDYRYPHDYARHYVPQSYLPVNLGRQRFYEPGAEGEEATLAQRWRSLTASQEDSEDAGPV
ncbi:MAG: replication-associated recombination protein A [Candidatus Geothermincolia bacterium]